MSHNRNKRPKYWPFLLILPLGLALGLIVGRAVDPDDTAFKGEDVSIGGDAPARDRAQLERPGDDLRSGEGPFSRRPELDYDEEVWPDDYAWRRSGEPDAYDFFDDESLSEEDYAPAPLPAPDSEQARPAQSGQSTRSDPSDRYASVRNDDAGQAAGRGSQPEPGLTREPRTADGELPAIW